MKRARSDRSESAARARVGVRVRGAIPQGARLAVLAVALISGGCREPDPVVFPEAGLVLVSIDTLRADHLSLYGYPRPTSPFLDELARESIVFENAIVQSTWTTPSHAALFTSRYPTELGLRPWPDPGQIPDRFPMLGERLRDAGLRTRAHTESAWMSGKFGFARGFEDYDESGGLMRSILPRALVTLNQLRDSRFFLFLHTYDVHWYDPTVAGIRPFLRPYAGELRAGGVLRQDVQRGNNREWREALAPDDVAFITDLYDGSIRDVDDALRRLDEELGRLGLRDRVIVVITSDHGEELMDHGRTGHGYSVYEEQIRVPLLIRLPNAAHGGRRIAPPVRGIDIVPTVLDLLAIDHDESELRGRSLVPLLTGRDAPRRAFIDRGHVDAVGIRSERFKLVWDRKRDRWSAYDLANDPEEREDLLEASGPASPSATESSSPADPGSGARAATALRAELDRWLDSLEAPEEPPASVPLTPRERRRIEELGYGR